MSQWFKYVSVYLCKRISSTIYKRYITYSMWFIDLWQGRIFNIMTELRKCMSAKCHSSTKFITEGIISSDNIIFYNPKNGLS